MPIASAWVAHRDRYFDLLDEYCSGHVQPLVLAFSTATRIAAAEARVTVNPVLELPDRWREALGPVRTGSATDRLLTRLPDLAAFTAEDAHDEIGGPLSSTYTAIERLAAPRSSDPWPTASATRSGVPPPSPTNSTTSAPASSGMRDVNAFSTGEGGASWKTSAYC